MSKRTDKPLHSEKLPRSPRDLEGWQPLVSDPPDSRWRAILSRLALVLAGGICLAIAWHLQARVDAIVSEEIGGRRSDNASPGQRLSAIATWFWLGGGFLLLGGLLPTRLFARAFGRVN